MLCAVIKVSTASPLYFHLRHVGLHPERPVVAALRMRSLRQPDQKKIIFLKRRNQVSTQTVALGANGCAFGQLQGTGSSVCR
jgi:hypothetical protein